MDIQTIVTEILSTGMTQQTLANMVPCSQNLISGYFTGRRGKQISMNKYMSLLAIHKKLKRKIAKK